MGRGVDWLDLTRVVFSDEKFIRWHYTGPAQNSPIWVVGAHGKPARKGCCCCCCVAAAVVALLPLVPGGAALLLRFGADFRYLRLCSLSLRPLLSSCQAHSSAQHVACM